MSTSPVMVTTPAENICLWLMTSLSEISAEVYRPTLHVEKSCHSDAVGPAWDSVTSWEWDPLRRLVTLLLFAFRHTKQTWIPFPSLFTTHVDVSKIRIPPLHTFNVPSCRTNHARSVGPQPIVVSWDRRKHILAVFHWPSKRTMLMVITIKCMFALAWVPFTCCRF